MKTGIIFQGIDVKQLLYKLIIGLIFIFPLLSFSQQLKDDTVLLSYSENEYYGFIDSVTEKIVIPCKYEKISGFGFSDGLGFHDDYACVKYKGK